MFNKVQKEKLGITGRTPVAERVVKPNDVSHIDDEVRHGRIQQRATHIDQFLRIYTADVMVSFVIEG